MDALSRFPKACCAGRTATGGCGNWVSQSATVCGRLRPFVWRKTERDRQLEKVEALAQSISIPREAMARDRRSPADRGRVYDLRSIPFAPPVGLLPENYASFKEARRGIYEQFGIPLGKLSDDVLEAIDQILQETLNRREVYRRVKELFTQYRVGG
jgi:hypothetical protein